MAELPEGYIQFNILLAMPPSKSMKVDLVRVLMKLGADVLDHWPTHISAGPHVMAVRDQDGELIGAITRTKGE